MIRAEFEKPARSRSGSGLDQFRRVFRHDGLNAQPGDAETEFIRQARLERPLLVKVDGRCGRGGICYSD